MTEKKNPGPRKVPEVPDRKPEEIPDRTLTGEVQFPAVPETHEADAQQPEIPDRKLPEIPASAPDSKIEELDR